MKNLNYILSMLLMITFVELPHAQQINTDSLFGVWSDESQNDTIRLQAMHDIAWFGYLFTQPDSAFYYAQLEFDYAHKKGHLRMKARALNTQGASFYIRGDFDKAIKYYSKCLNQFVELKDSSGIANLQNNIGNIHYDKGDFDQAIDYYNQSLKIREEINDSLGIAASLNNIGSIYSDQGDDVKSIDYYSRSLAIRKSIGDRQGMANSYSNIGSIYSKKNQFESAIEYYNKSLEINKEIGDNQGIARILNQIGIVYRKQKRYEEALVLFTQNLDLNERIGDKQGKAIALNNIGIIYQIQGNYDKSISYSEQALALAQDVGLAIETRDVAYTLHLNYDAKGNKQKALEMYELYISTRDTLLSEENQREVLRQEYKYAYDKQKAIDDKENEKKLAISAEQEKKQKVISYAITTGLALVLLFSFFIYNRLKITRKQKLVIEEQKEIVEEKNQEIMDSITYAKRIQSAILPPDKVVKEYLENSFILYKPKDIVAGDFYWMESVPSSRHSALDAESPNKEEIAGKASNDDIVLFAAADCTGHGVPGAMVSVVCNNALNRSVREHGLTDPGEILNKTREIVIQEFEKSEEEVKDGMDIALCSLEGNKLQYAGAHNPLWIIRPSVIASEERTKQSSQSKDSPFEGNTRDVSENVGDDLSKYTSLKTQHATLYEVKADKQPIGKFDNPLPYTTHTFELLEGDTIYIFSDGYVDQFGGAKGKKFKAKAFRELLLSIQEQTMEQQRASIDQAFETWKGNLEQIDDVCVIGVRI